MRRLCIVGAGGHGVVVAEAAELSQRWTDIYFLDKQVPESGRVLDFQVNRSDDETLYFRDQDAEFIVAIGDNAVRQTYIDRITAAGGAVVSVIHPSAVISNSAAFGPGTVVCANAVVNARTRAGAACIINTAATIDHDCTLADAVHVSPGANVAGGVRIADRAWVGMGSTIRQGLSVGADAVIGASAAVVADIQASTTVVGVPARPLSE